MPRLKPQTTKSLVELIVDEIKGSILSGDMGPGEPVSITDLASELDVSHIPVREALRRLEAEGLIQLRPSRSAIVTRLSLGELEEIYRLRLAIETDLAARSAKSYTTAQLELAEALCDELRTHGHGSGTNPDERAVHHRLHGVLLEPAAGLRSTRILWQLWEGADRYIGFVYAAKPVGPEEPYRRHLELVEAAKRKSAPVMRKAVAEHIQRSLDYMVEALAGSLAELDGEPVETAARR